MTRTMACMMVFAAALSAQAAPRAEFGPVNKTAAIAAEVKAAGERAARLERIAAAVQVLKAESAAGNKVAQAALVLFKELASEVKE